MSVETYTPTTYDKTLAGHRELVQDFGDTARAIEADRPRADYTAKDFWQKLRASLPTEPEGVPAWNTFRTEIAGNDPYMAENLEAYREYNDRLSGWKEVPGLKQEVIDDANERKAARTAVGELYAAMTASESAADEITAIRLRAARRPSSLMTPREKERIAELSAAAAPEALVNIPPGTPKEALEADVDHLYRMEDKRQYNSGLLMTDQMKSIINQVAPSLMRGIPARFLGETGGAKSNLAEYIARNILGHADFEHISGSEGANKYDLIARDKLSSDNGTTVTETIYGPVLRAIRDGKPLIIDEIDSMPPEFLKSLNKILLLRPGKTFTPAETSEPIPVKQGFCVMATDNNASKHRSRYKGTAGLSAELNNRFATNTYEVRYPDADVPTGAPAIDNERLAFAAATHDNCELPDWIYPADFDNLVRAAHVTQKLFSGSIDGQLKNSYVSTPAAIDGQEYGLRETVLSPRVLASALENIKASGGAVTIRSWIGHYLSGIGSPDDKKVMALVLRDHRLLQEGQ